MHLAPRLTSIDVQQVLRTGQASNLKYTDARLNTTIHLALHCVGWNCGQPATLGEVVWEERWVGPAVTNALQHLFREDPSRKRQGANVIWTGCVNPLTTPPHGRDMVTA